MPQDKPRPTILISSPNASSTTECAWWSGADATEATQSFIDNIAIEYRLDAANNRYVRLFYDRNAHDPLEGTLMKTGAGFVMRRKSERFGDLFIQRRKKKSTTEKSNAK